VPEIFGRQGVVDEPLHEYAIDSMIFHPLKVAQHSFAVVGAKNLRRTAVCVPEGCGVTFVRVQFTYVRPKINPTASRLKSIPSAPMAPASIATVAASAQTILDTRTSLCLLMLRFPLPE